MNDFLLDNYGYIMLYSNLITKLLLIVGLLVLIIFNLLLFFNETKKNIELTRLKELNDGLEKIYKVPIKKAAQWLENRK